MASGTNYSPLTRLYSKMPLISSYLSLHFIFTNRDHFTAFNS